MPPSAALFLFLLICLCPLQASALNQVQVTGLSNMNLPSWNLGDPAVASSIDICVYSVSLPSSDNYDVTISSPGGFYLSNGTRQIPYTLSWDDGGAGHLGATSGAAILNNTTLPRRSHANTLSALCALGVSGPTARLNLKITQSDMIAALAGTYTGTITIMIAAN